jgi:hypothetical protein
LILATHSCTDSCKHQGLVTILTYMRSLKVATLLQVYETLTRDEQEDVDHEIAFMRVGVHYQNAKLLGEEAMWLERILRKPDRTLPYKHFMTALAQWQAYLSSIQSAKMQYGRGSLVYVNASTKPGIIQRLIGRSVDGTEHWESYQSMQKMMHTWCHTFTKELRIYVDGVYITDKLYKIVWG